MRKVPGERLAEVICRKFYNNQARLRVEIFTSKVARFRVSVNGAHRGLHRELVTFNKSSCSGLVGMTVIGSMLQTASFSSCATAQLALLDAIFENLGATLASFHERYGKQHGDG